jgi:hypothetical protein
MQRHVRRHRYPKKRNIPRALLLFALPALLIALLLGTSAILTGGAPEEPLIQAMRPDIIDDLPPDVVGVTLHIRPRTTHLKTETMQFTEYLTFFSHIPLEPLRQTLFSEAR